MLKIKLGIMYVENKITFTQKKKKKNLEQKRRQTFKLFIIVREMNKCIPKNKE